ncbi:MULTISPECIES: DAK2 domain-containing protein [Mesotoga]|uniref:DAK2 domain-containing protein n=4 Tax=Kosmotogaceae TaxID=1643948 RepID=UPI0002CC7CD4|nr:MULTISPECIES: DAK2 domain-containing protein [Mesotoga]MCP5456784.1 DAK2 domain-containing protein [Thermotogota bacterium]CCU86123.1 DAK2 domain fusion protein YloV [Mesotoga infera]RLL86768.1 Dak phosphatase [Mesotoga sp. H07pep.5.4]RLL92366.1 Dak phosphatase [Mesotoga sp. HF07.pep.5.2.highcov]HNQ71422.1 DAK2 domain-containing protein [Mesotoga prima]
MKRINGKFFVAAFRKAAERLLANKDEINALNVFPVPDGDTGSNMAAAMIEACEYLDRLKKDDLVSVLEAVKTGMLMGARGNSGVILSQIFRGFAEGIGNRKFVNTKAFTEGLVKAKEIAYRSVMKPVEGTMLTVMRVTADTANEQFGDIEDFEEYFENLIHVAFDAVEKTPTLLPKLKEAGVVDSGAKGLAYILEGFVLAVKGDLELEGPIQQMPQAMGSSTERIVEIVREELKFTYCTELIVSLNDSENPEEVSEEMKSYLDAMGDSIVMVHQDDIIKIHVHTDHPGDVIEKFLGVGLLQKVKIDNMKVQHEHIVDIQSKGPEMYGKGKRHGVIVVSPGEGLADVLKSLGVDHTVKGGQTMNPSLKDLYEAINRIAADKVIVLPNNPNIILTAKEAANAIKDENPGKEVYIIPTRTVQEGIAAMTVYNDEMDSEALIAEMKEAADSISPISITYAVRDSSMKGKKIRKGEYIAIGRDGLISSGRKLEKLVHDSIKATIGKDSEKEVVTIFYGSEVTEESAGKLLESLSGSFSDLEFEIHSGGQPYYYYLISIE